MMLVNPIVNLKETNKSHRYGLWWRGRDLRKTRNHANRLKREGPVNGIWPYCCENSTWTDRLTTQCCVGQLKKCFKTRAMVQIPHLPLSSLMCLPASAEASRICSYLGCMPPYPGVYFAGKTASRLRLIGGNQRSHLSSVVIGPSEIHKRQCLWFILQLNIL